MSTQTSRRWVVKEAAPDAVEHIAHHFSLPMSLAHMLVARGIDDKDKVQRFMDASLSKLISPFELHHMEQACQRLAHAIEHGQKVLIHGDFDADGITSSALFTLFFQEIGFDVETYIPNRLRENHGISPKAIDKAIDEGFSLLITCDCGSTSLDAIARLVENQIDVIVTDHHQVDDDALPQNCLIVNPQRADNASNMEELSGVGVVFLTLMGLRKVLREKNFFEHREEPNLKRLLDVVALGTIADLAPIRGMNRILVGNGLDVMTDEPQAGLEALKKHAQMDPAQPLTSEDVAFRLAPRINAAARLGHADDAFALLIEKDMAKADILAQALGTFNQKRRQVQDEMTNKVQGEITRQVEQGHHVLVLASKDFHPGVIGLLSQKICQEYGKPVFSFAIENDRARGSARAPKGVNLVVLMDEVSQRLQEYGGHAQAGGCTTQVSQLQNLTQDFQQAFEKHFSSVTIAPLEADARLSFSELNEVFFEKLKSLEPFGMGCPAPIFEVNATVQGKPFEVGKNHLKGVVKDPTGQTFPVIAFGKYAAWRDTFHGERALLIQPQRQIYRGRPQITLQLLDFV